MNDQRYPRGKRKILCFHIYKVNHFSFHLSFDINLSVIPIEGAFRRNVFLAISKR